MAEAPATSDETEQCIALTSDGERCSRTARDGDFCYQHGESDETVDEVAADGGTEAESGGDSGSDAADGGDGNDADSGDGNDADSGDESDAGAEASDIGREGDETVDADADGIEDPAEGTGGDSVDIMEVRRIIETTASDLIGRELDGISEIRAEEDGWLVVVDLIERPAVPDSQDILGSYEIELGPGGAIQGYRRVNRYRRSDTADVE